MLQNYMELLVNKVYNEVKDEYNLCENSKCENDIKSMALNNLPPMYFLSNVSDGERAAFLIDRQRKISVLSQLTQAVDAICGQCEYRQKKRTSL